MARTVREQAGVVAGEARQQARDVAGLPVGCGRGRTRRGKGDQGRSPRPTHGRTAGRVDRFGAGLLAAALIPESEAERRAVTRTAEPVIEPVKEGRHGVRATVSRMTPNRPAERPSTRPGTPRRQRPTTPATRFVTRHDRSPTKPSSRPTTSANKRDDGCRRVSALFPQCRPWDCGQAAPRSSSAECPPVERDRRAQRQRPERAATRRWLGAA